MTGAENWKLGHDWRLVRSHRRHDATRLRCWQIVQTRQDSSRLSPFTLVLVLQGSVATKLSYGGKFFILLWAISFWFRHWKNFKNRPTFAKVTVKIKVAQFFFDSQCTIHWDVALGLGPWLSLRTKLWSLVLGSGFGLEAQFLVNKPAIYNDDLVGSKTKLTHARWR